MSLAFPSLVLPADGPFDQFLGMPLHPVIVHLSVVLLPLAALLVLALVAVPRWRAAFAKPTLVLLLIGLISAWISKQSGEALAADHGGHAPATHAQWGDMLPLGALALAAVAGTWLVLVIRQATQEREAEDYYGADEREPLTRSAQYGAGGDGAWYDRLDSEYVDDRGPGVAAGQGYPTGDAEAYRNHPYLAAGQDQEAGYYAEQGYGQDGYGSYGRHEQPTAPLGTQGFRGPQGSHAVGFEAEERYPERRALPAWFGPLGIAAAVLSLVVLVQSLVAGQTGLAAAWGPKDHGGGGAAGKPTATASATTAPTSAATTAGAPTKSPTTSASPTHTHTHTHTDAPTGTDTDEPDPDHTDGTDAPSTAATDTPSPTATGGAAGATHTMAEVAKHSAAASCWTAISGNVYDLTDFIATHPGGEGPIVSLCGQDGTQAFADVHGDEKEPNDALEKLKIGPLAK